MPFNLTGEDDLIAIDRIKLKKILEPQYLERKIDEKMSSVVQGI